MNNQINQISAIRKRFFDAATSAHTDRAKAEQAAAIIVAPALIRFEIHWCSSPAEVTSLWGSLRASLRVSLWDSLRAALSDSLRASLSDSLWDSLRASLRVSLRASLRVSLWDSLWDSLSDSLSASLWAALSDSLRASLSDSLWDSLRASLRVSLSDSLWDSLWDSGFIACCVAARDLHGVVYRDGDNEKLNAVVSLLTSAFAVWAIPGHVILLEKPKAVQVVDGKLVSVEW